MDKPRKYKRAPITEAIIDLRVSPRPDLELAVIKAIAESDVAEYPSIAEFREAHGNFQVGPGPGDQEASVEARTLGFQSVARDGKSIIRRLTNGFAYFQRAPYDTWVPFQKSARTFWKDYRDTTSPDRVTRIAVRYINRIDIPTPGNKAVELSDYFRVYPEFPDGIHSYVDGFLIQVRMGLKDGATKAVINQTLAPPAKKGVLSVILDQDLYRENSVPQEEEAIWDAFEALRLQKDEVFESSITDATRELIT